jgi:hypothetical protein
VNQDNKDATGAVPFPDRRLLSQDIRRPTKAIMFSITRLAVLICQLRFDGQKSAW